MVQLLGVRSAQEKKRSERGRILSPLLEGSSDAGAAYIRATKKPLIGHSCSCCQSFSSRRLTLPTPCNACSATFFSALTCKPALSKKNKNKKTAQLTSVGILCFNHARQPARTPAAELCQSGVQGRTGCSTARAAGLLQSRKGGGSEARPREVVERLNSRIFSLLGSASKQPTL